MSNTTGLSPSSFVIRRGTTGDAEPLAAFAARTFTETFAAANRPEDMAAYVPSAYGATQQSNELADPDIVTLIVEDVSQTIIAYAMLRRGQLPACVPDQSSVELWRFYVDRLWHGSGLAQQLIAAVRAAATELAARTLWLGVWEKNDRAIAFYEKTGFRVVGEHDFWVGSDRQIDLIMVTQVNQP